MRLLCLFFTLLFVAQSQQPLKAQQPQLPNRLQTHIPSSLAMSKATMMLIEVVPHDIEALLVKLTTASERYASCALAAAEVTCEACDSVGCQVVSTAFDFPPSGSIRISNTLRNDVMRLDVYDPSTSTALSKSVKLPRRLPWVDVEEISIERDSRGPWSVIGVEGADLASGERVLRILKTEEEELAQHFPKADLMMLQRDGERITGKSMLSGVWKSHQTESLTSAIRISRDSQHHSTLHTVEQGLHQKRQLQASFCGFPSGVDVSVTGPGETCVFSSDFTIENVTINGFGLKPGCEHETCRYCPFLPSPNTNDQGEDITDIIDQYALYEEYCAIYAEQIFLAAIGTVTLTLNNVTFTGMRQSFKSLIYLQDSAQLYLNNVNFDTCQCNVAVLQIVDTGAATKPSIYYNIGEVKGLNVGFEASALYAASLGVSKFLQTESADKIKITNVTFQYNHAINKQMFEIGQLNEFELSCPDEDCKFEYNLGRGIFQLAFQSKLPVVPNADDQADLHYKNNVWIHDIRFSNNGALENIVFIFIGINSEPINITLENVVFENNIAAEAVTSNILRIQNEQWPAPSLYLGCEEVKCNPYGINGAPDLYYPPRVFKLYDVVFESNKSSTTLYLQKYPWADLQKVTARNNRGYDGQSDTISQGIRQFDSYGKIDILTTPVNHLITLFVGKEAINRLTLDNLTLQKNDISETTESQMQIFTHSSLFYETWELRNIWILENTATNAAANGLAIIADSDTFPVITIDKITIEGNTSTGTVGATLVLAGSLQVTNMECHRNTGQNTCVQTYNGKFISIKDSKFKENVSDFQSTVLKTDNMVTGYSFEFINNEVIGNISELQTVWCWTPSLQMSFSIQGNLFEENSGDTVILLEAVELVDPTIAPSEFRGNTFNKNEGIRESTVAIVTNVNHIDIIENIFTNNSGSVDLITIQNNAAMYPIFSVGLEDNFFEQNTADGNLIAIRNIANTGVKPQVRSLNNIYSHNNARSLFVEVVDFKDEQSLCENNTALNGGCYTALGCIVELKNSTYTGNIGTDGRQGAFSMQQSVTTVKNCTISDNFGDIGAAFQIFGGHFNFQDTVFENNTALEGSAIYTQLGQDIEMSTITDCIFKDNYADSHGALAIFDREITILSSEFIANESRSSSPTIMLKRVTRALIEGVTIRDQSSVWGGYLRAQDSILTIVNCEFNGIEKSSDNIGIYLLSSEVELSDSNFSNFYGKSIIDATNCELTIRGSNSFDNNHNLGPLINILDGSIMISDLNIDGIRSGAMTMFNAEVNLILTSIRNGDFIALFTTDVIECIDCISLQVDEITMRNITGQQSSLGIKVYDTELQAHYHVNDPYFEDCSGVTSGGIYLFKANVTIKDAYMKGCQSQSDGGGLNSLNSNMNISASLFEQNRATKGGGAIKVECDNNCELNIKSTDFQGNEANSGGAVEFDTDFVPPGLEIDQTTNTFTNNKAKYGDDIASYPKSIELLDIGGVPVRRRLQDDAIYIEDGIPGQPLPTIRIAILDLYGTIVNTNSDSLCKAIILDLDKSASIANYEVASNEGMCIFDNLRVFAPPDQNIRLEIESFAIDTTRQTGAVSKIQFTTYLRN